MAERKVKQWITINGVHVPIFEGESKADAAKRFKEKIGKRNESQPMTQNAKSQVKKEYTYARNAAHNAKPEKQEKANERFEKAKNKYSKSKEAGVIKSAKRTDDRSARSSVYKEQLKDVQEDIKQFESTPERLRSADYEKRLAELKKKEASLKGYIDRDKPTQAGKNDDIIQEIRYKGEISRKDENGKWKVVGHYDNKKQDVQVNKDLDEKEKQLARNKAEADSLSGKSDYIVSKNSLGQELKIPRKTYEDRLERLKQYKQDLYDMANRPHSRYKLDPRDLRKVDDQIKDIENKLKTGRDEQSVDAIRQRDDLVKQLGITSGQATMKMKKEMGFTNEDFVVKGGKQERKEEEKRADIEYLTALYEAQSYRQERGQDTSKVDAKIAEVKDRLLKDKRTGQEGGLSDKEMREKGYVIDTPITDEMVARGEKKRVAREIADENNAREAKIQEIRQRTGLSLEDSERQLDRTSRPFEAYSSDQLQKTYSQYMKAGNAEGANAVTKELAERNKQDSKSQSSLNNYLKENNLTMQDVYNEIKSNPKMRDTANELLKQGMEFEQASTMAYRQHMDKMDRHGAKADFNNSRELWKADREYRRHEASGVHDRQALKEGSEYTFEFNGRDGKKTVEGTYEGTELKGGESVSYFKGKDGKRYVLFDEDIKGNVKPISGGASYEKKLDNIGKQIRASHNREEIQRLERKRDQLIQEHNAGNTSYNPQKSYKVKGPVAAAKSAGEMLGIDKPNISIKRETAIDTTYSLKDKDGNEVGIYTESRTGKGGKLTLYKYKNKKG